MVEADNLRPVDVMKADRGTLKSKDHNDGVPRRAAVCIEGQRVSSHSEI